MIIETFDFDLLIESFLSRPCDVFHLQSHIVFSESFRADAVRVVSSACRSTYKLTIVGILLVEGFCCYCN